MVQTNRREDLQTDSHVSTVSHVIWGLRRIESRTHYDLRDPATPHFSLIIAVLEEYSRWVAQNRPEVQSCLHERDGAEVRAGSD